MRKLSAALCLATALVMMLPTSGWTKKKDRDDGPWDGYEENLPPGQAKKQRGGPPPWDGYEDSLPPGQAKKKRGGGPPPWAPAHGYRAKQAYRYYPRYNVYQDPGSGVFFTFQAGAWIKGGLPGWLTGRDLGPGYDFQGDADRPYQGNRSHKRQYRDD